MYLKKQLFTAGLTVVLLVVFSFNGAAQFSLGVQVRARGEYRDGFANLLSKTASPADFISQRTRLSLGYKWNFLAVGGTLQDVRVWGQDASSISSTDGSKLMLHEGWAEIILANKADTSNQFKLIDYLSLKIGRQELVYDDARLVGNLDWLMQGRRFDMALLKALHKGWQFELGYAYNQNSERLSGNLYVPGNVPQYVKNDVGVLVTTPDGMVPLTNSSGNSAPTGNPTYTNPPTTNGGTQDYKRFLSFYVSKTVNHTKVSGLFFKDDFGKYRTASVESGGGFVYGRYFDVAGTSNRFTYGLMLQQVFPVKSNNSSFNAQLAFYQQSGHDRDDKSLQAYHYTAFLNYTKSKVAIGAGFDVLSGNTTTTGSTESQRFDPLYGTPHKFWGYMDYFYAGTGSPAQGLKDAYLKTKFIGKSYSLGLDYHYFAVANQMAATSQKNIGSEWDLIASCSLNKFTTIDLGYSYMLATDAMAYAKAQAPAIAAENFDKTAQWAYLSVSIKPDFFFPSKSSGSKL